MSEHLLDDGFKKYMEREMDPAELLEADDHLAACDSCSGRLAELMRNREFSDILQFSPDEPVHLTYTQLSNYVDEKADGVQREIADVHLEVCAECTAELNNLYQMRNLIAADSGNAPEKKPFFAGIRGFFAESYIPKVGFTALGLLLLALGVYWTQKPGSPTEVVEIQPTPIIETPQNTTPPVNAETNSPTPTPSPGESESIPAEYQAEIERVLAENRLNFPADIDQLDAQAGKLMSGGSDAVPFALSGPIGKIIISNRPQFSWKALPGASGYVVNIYDGNFNPVASSSQISGTNWQVNKSLSSGKVYIWQVTAIRDGQEIKSPVRPAPDARFKILEANRASELSRLSREYKDEHLFLGIMYAKAGLLTEAEREFQKELSKNPGSKEARKFLQDVRRIK